MIITLTFDDFVRITNNLTLQWYYQETIDSFHIFALLDAHVFQTRIKFSEITEGQKDKERALQLFRLRYLSRAFKPIETDLPAPKPSTLPTIEYTKETTTEIGGEGTPGQALIPVTFPAVIKRRCMQCGYIGTEMDRCPKCGGKMQSMATGAKIKVLGKQEELTLLKWVGWDYIMSVPWIIKFLERYGFKDIDVSEKDRKRIKEIMIESMTRGHSIPIIEDKINEVVKDRVRAEMIARSETIRAANEGALLQYEEKEVKKVKFIAIPGFPAGRTCEVCLNLNEKEFTLEKARGMIPIHPNCRCTWSAVIET